MESLQKRRISISLVILMIFLLCIVAFLFAKYIPSYAIQVFVSSIILALSIFILFKEKHITIFTFFLFVSGLLFILSASISYGYTKTIEPLTVLQQIEFYKILRPEQISRGLGNIGMSISYITFVILIRSKPFANKYKWHTIFILIVSILLFLFGIYSVIQGSSRL